MRLYVISLATDHERRLKISRLLAKTSLNWRFFDAVHFLPGNQIDSRLLLLTGIVPESLINQDQAKHIVGRPLIPGDIGCVMSHLVLYYTFLQTNFPCICVLEDDALFNPQALESFLSSYREKDLMPAITLLGHMSYPYLRQDFGAEVGPVPVELCSINRFRLFRPVEFPFLTHAYIINRKACKLMLKYGLPISMPIDWLTGSAELLGIELKVLSPPISLQSQAAKGTVQGREYPKQTSKIENILSPMFWSYYTRLKKAIRLAIIAGRKQGVWRTSYIPTLSLRLYMHLLWRRCRRSRLFSSSSSSP